MAHIKCMPIYYFCQDLEPKTSDTCPNVLRAHYSDDESQHPRMFSEPNLFKQATTKKSYLIRALSPSPTPPHGDLIYYWTESEKQYVLQGFLQQYIVIRLLRLLKLKPIADKRDQGSCISSGPNFDHIFWKSIFCGFDKYTLIHWEVKIILIHILIHIMIKSLVCMRFLG